MKKLIKEAVPFNDGGGHFYVIRTNTYADSIHHFQSLSSEAMADFPRLDPSDVYIKHYGGDSIRQTYGVEWRAEGELKDGYALRERLHPTIS